MVQRLENEASHVSQHSINNARNSARSGRSSRASKYTKTAEGTNEDVTEFPDIDYDTDIDEDVEKEPNEYDTAATGRKLYNDACKLYAVIPVSYFFRFMEHESFNIDHRQLGPKSARAMAVALTVNTNILKFSIRDNGIGKDGATALAEMLIENNYIQEIDVSENKIGKSGSNALFSMLLENITVQKLVLERCGLANDAINGMIVPLAQAQKLEHLCLSGNQITNGDLLGKAIAENASLKTVDLSWNLFRARDGVRLIKGLQESVTITHLDLGYCGLDDSCAAILKDLLQNNTILEILKLHTNSLYLPSSVALGEGLKTNQSLKELYLGRNPFLSEGCVTVAKALVNNSESPLEVLDFTDIVTGKDFKELKLNEIFPSLKITTGGSWMERKIIKPKVEPMAILKEYMEKHNLRLADFFNKLDTDGSMSLSREEFRDGIMMAGIPLTENQIEQLMDTLDKDGDGEINYSASRKRLNCEI